MSVWLFVVLGRLWPRIVAIVNPLLLQRWSINSDTESIFGRIHHTKEQQLGVYSWPLIALTHSSLCIIATRTMGLSKIGAGVLIEEQAAPRYLIEGDCCGYVKWKSGWRATDFPDLLSSLHCCMSCSHTQNGQLWPRDYTADVVVVVVAVCRSSRPKCWLSVYMYVVSGLAVMAFQRCCCCCWAVNPNSVVRVISELLLHFHFFFFFPFLS